MSSDRRSREAIGEHLLVLRCQVGDEAAFEELFDLYNVRVLYYLRRLVGTTGEAEDVMQEVWVRILRRIGTLREPTALRTWIYRIAHNLAVERLRRRGREVAFDDLAEVPEVTEDLEVVDPVDGPALHRALDRTSPAHRAVLTLRFMNELSYREIADVTGCSLGTVKSRLHFAKRSLRTEIERTDGGTR